MDNSSRIEEGDYALSIHKNVIGKVIKVQNMGGGVNDVTIRTDEEDILSSENNFRKISNL